MNTVSWVLTWLVGLVLSLASGGFGAYLGTGGHRPTEGNIDFTYLLVVPVALVCYLIGFIAGKSFVKKDYPAFQQFGMVIVVSQVWVFVGSLLVYALMLS